MIVTRVDNDPVQPCAEFGVASKLPEGSICLEKNLLGYIFGILSISKHIVCCPINILSVLIDDLPECLKIP